MTETDDASDDGGGSLRRRTLIRILVGLGIGIPIVIEGLTFLGLVGQSLGGDGGADGGGTPTDDGERDGRVGVGDELLPATPQTETLASASYRGSGDRWPLTLVVEVTNGADGPYELRLGAVRTEGGRDVEPESTPAVRLAAGESGSVTGFWRLPAGTSPSSLVAEVRQGEGSPESHRVELAKIPVQGQG